MISDLTGEPVEAIGIAKMEMSGTGVGPQTARRDLDCQIGQKRRVDVARVAKSRVPRDEHALMRMTAEITRSCDPRMCLSNVGLRKCSATS